MMHLFMHKNETPIKKVLVLTLRLVQKLQINYFSNNTTPRSLRNCTDSSNE